MRILQVVHGFLPRHAGGTERYVARLVEAMRLAGHEVGIVCGSDEGQARASWDEESWHGVPVFVLGRSGLYLESWYRSWNPEVEAMLSEVLEHFGPDLVHVHHWHRLTRNLVEVIQLAGYPVVVTLHDTSSTCPRSFRIRDGRFCTRHVTRDNCIDCVDRFWFQDEGELGRLIELYRDDFRQELESAGSVIVPSAALRDLVAEHLPSVKESIVVLPNGRLDRPRKERTAPRQSGPLRLAYWGAIQAMKGVHLLVEAVGQLSDPASVTVDVWGEAQDADQSYEAGLRQKAEESSLPVRFHGAFSPDDIPADYDLAVFPSICFESHSFTVDEAFARGIPILVADRGALVERVGEAGATFHAGDAADLAQVLEGLVEAPKWIDEWRGAIPDLMSMTEHAALLVAIYKKAARGGAWAERIDPGRSRLRVRNLTAQLEERDRCLYQLRGEVDQERTRAAGLDHEVVVREEGIKSQAKILTEFNANLGELAATLKERDDEVAKLSERLKTQGASFEARLARRDADLAKRAAEIESFSKSTSELRVTLERRNADLEALYQHADALEKQIQKERKQHAKAARAMGKEREEELSRAAARLEELEQAAAQEREARGEVERAVQREQDSRAEVEERLAAARAALTRVEAMRDNLLSQVDELRSAMDLRDQALAQALDDLQSAAEGYDHLCDTVGRRLAPLGEAAAGRELAASSPDDIIEHVVRNNDRLHRLIVERDELLGMLVHKVDDYERERAEWSGEDRAASNGRATTHWIKKRIAALKRRRRRARGGDRLRILFVVHDFLPKHNAGTEIYTFNLARDLARRHDVHLMFCEARHELPRYTVSQGAYEGLPYTEVVHNYQWESFEETYHDPRMEEIFADVLDEVQPDIVHVQHLHYFSFRFVSIAKERGLPVVYTLHEFMLLCARGGQLLREDMEICEQPVPAKCADCIRHEKLAADYGQGPRHGAVRRVAELLPESMRRAFEGFSGPLVPALTDETRPPFERAARARLDFILDCVKDVDLFISPSAFLRQKFIDSGMVRAEQIIHSDNGFDLTPFSGFERRPSETLRFGFVGTIAEYKGIHVLVDAFNEIDDDDVELQIWGDLDTFVEYKEVLVPRIANPRIRLMGRFDNTRIADVLAGIDVLVVPSLWFENSPLTIHEAWLARMPVLASDRGGMAELVDDGVNGLHFRLGDAGDLREKMRRIIADRSLVRKLGDQPGPVKSIADNAREIEGLYVELLRGAARR